MILTNKELRPLIFGAVEMAEKDGLLRPLRFGFHVRENVYPAGNKFRNSMFHTAGVMLSLVTDTRSFAFSYLLTSTGADRSFDVWANGVFYHHEVLNKGMRGTVNVTLPAGEKTVTVYFPYNCGAQIYDVTLDDGATVKVPTKDCNILFIGDSITHGHTAIYSSMTYPCQVARALNAHIINQGIGGERFNPMAVDAELPFEPDLIVVAYGTNDWSHGFSRARMVGACNGHFAALRDKYPKTPIVSILPLWRGDANRTTGVGSFEEAREIVRDAATRFGVQVVDGMELVPHVPSVYADLRLHPNAFGFQFYAEELLKRLPDVRKK